MSDRVVAGPFSGIRPESTRRSSGITFSAEAVQADRLRWIAARHHDWSWRSPSATKPFFAVIDA